MCLRAKKQGPDRPGAPIRKPGGGPSFRPARSANAGYAYTEELSELGLKRAGFVLTECGNKS